MSDQIEVTDADREAAHKWAMEDTGLDVLAQDFAANRQAAARAERERCVAIILARATTERDRAIEDEEEENEPEAEMSHFASLVLVGVAKKIQLTKGPTR